MNAKAKGLAQGHPMSILIYCSWLSLLLFMKFESISNGQ